VYVLYYRCRRKKNSGIIAGQLMMTVEGQFWIYFFDGLVPGRNVCTNNKWDF
jgi:hypothetical protein